MSLRVCETCCITYDTQDGIGWEFRRVDGCPCCELKDKISQLEDDNDTLSKINEGLSEVNEKLEDDITELKNKLGEK